MSPKVLVTGATGLLGREVVKEFSRAGWDVVSTGFTRASPSVLKLDLNSSAAVLQVLQDTQPQVVVHCAANRFPDKCSSDPEGTRALNISASRSLAQVCAAAGIVLIYISTDYVFPGTPGDAPYEVDASPAPTNLYGETKLGGEQAVLEAYQHGGGVVLRVPVLYGPVAEEKGNAESAVNCLMDAVWKAQEETVSMDHWALRYPTSTEDIGRVCKDIAAKYLEAGDKSTLPKILHFSSEDKFTKYEICQLFAEILGLPLEKMIANTQGNEPGASVQRPYDCHLSGQALRDLGIPTSTMDFKAFFRRDVRAFRK